MRKADENRAENYIKKHKNNRRWLAFALCVALFTGTVTLYMLNKPATAMTEDGASSIGIVLETADDEFESGLIEQTYANASDSDREESAESVDVITLDVSQLESGDSGDIEDIKSWEDMIEEVLPDESASEGSEAASSEDSSDEDASDASSDDSADAASSNGSTSEKKTVVKKIIVENSYYEDVEDVVITARFVDTEGEEIADSAEFTMSEDSDYTTDLTDAYSEIDDYYYKNATIDGKTVTRITQQTGQAELITEEVEKEIEVEVDKSEDIESVEDETDEDSDKEDSESADSASAYSASTDDEEDELLDPKTFIYYVATDSDGNEIEILEDTEIIFNYIKKNTKNTFTYSGDDVTVTVKLSDPGVLPEGVELSVTTLDKDTEGYNYDAYIEALNNSADEIAQANGNEVSEQYDENNTVLFDIAFILDGIEYEPGYGTVSVSIKFADKQISSGLDTENSDEVAIVHLSVDSDIMQDVATTSEATDIDSSNVTVEVLTDSEVELGNSTDVITFETRSFSVYGAIKTSSTTTWTGGQEYSAKEIVSWLGDATYFGAVSTDYDGKNNHSEANIAVVNISNIQNFTIGNSTTVYTVIDEYYVTVNKVVTGSSGEGTYYFALFSDEDGTSKISGSEFSITTDSEGVGSYTFDVSSYLKTGSYSRLYVYELDASGGNAVLNEGSFDTYTVTYDADELSGSSDLVSYFSDNYIENIGSNNAADLLQKVSGATIYYKTSDDSYVGVQYTGSGYTTTDYEGNFPVSVSSMLSDAKVASSKLAYATTYDDVEVVNLVGTSNGYLQADLTSKYFKSSSANYAVNTGFTIGGDTLLVINIDLTGVSSYTLDKFTVNKIGTGDWSEIANQIILNPVQLDSNGNYVPYTGTLYTDIMSGTLIAPDAEVTMYGSYSGTVIASSIIKQCEIHKITVRRFLDEQGSVYVTNTSAALEFQLYKYINGSDPGNETFNFTIKRLKDDMTGWSNGKFDSSTTDHTALTNDGNSIYYSFDPAYWSMTEGNTYYFRVTEDSLSSDSAYAKDDSQIYIKVEYTGSAATTTITYYRLGQDDENFDYWVSLLNTASSNKDSSTIKTVLVDGVCDDSDRIVTGTEVSFNNTCVAGKVSLSLLKYLDNEDPGDEEFSFTVQLVKPSGTYDRSNKEYGTLVTLDSAVANDGKNITFSYEYTTQDIYSNSLIFVIYENDITGDSSITKDDNYIIARVVNLGEDNQTTYYYLCDYDTDGGKDIIDRITGTKASANLANAIWAYTKNNSAISDSSQIAFYNTSNGYLRIHKMVVNDFGSYIVRDSENNSILNNVEFTATNMDTGAVIWFKGFTASISSSDSIQTAYEYVDGQLTGTTYTVYYNDNAQWTIEGIPSGTYTVREVADNYTFVYDPATDTSSPIDSIYSRVTKYGLTIDTNGATQYNVGGDNYRKTFSVDVSSITTLYDDPNDIKVKVTYDYDDTPTVQIANYYSNPMAPIMVTKQLTGGTWDSDTAFTFTIESYGTPTNTVLSDGTPVSVASSPLPSETSVTVYGDGTTSAQKIFLGEINYIYEGTYYYKVTEEQGSIDGIKYDSTVYYIKVEVSKYHTTFKKKYSYSKQVNYSYDDVTSDGLVYRYNEDFYYLGANVTYYKNDPTTSYSSKIVQTTEVRLKTDPNTSGTTYYGDYIISYSDDFNAVFINKYTGSLIVKKVWVNASGGDDSANHSTLNLTIWQRVVGTDTWSEYGTITLTQDSDWTMEVTGLPLSDTDGNDYEYSVKEADEYLSICHVTYTYEGASTATVDGNAQSMITVDDNSVRDTGYVISLVSDSKVDYGTVTITNKLINTNVMPSTGGSGTIPFAAAGAGLILLAFVGLYVSNRRNTI